MPILQDLFYGNVTPKNTFDRDSEYGRAIHAIADSEENLLALLGDAQRNHLFSLCDAQSALNSITAEEHFIQGFQLGALIMIEIFQNRKT